MSLALYVKLPDKEESVLATAPSKDHGREDRQRRYLEEQRDNWFFNGPTEYRSASYTIDTYNQYGREHNVQR